MNPIPKHSFILRLSFLAAIFIFETLRPEFPAAHVSNRENEKNPHYSISNYILCIYFVNNNIQTHYIFGKFDFVVGHKVFCVFVVGYIYLKSYP